ncbi:glycosyltransferase family 4 protein [Leptolyngbya boryana CZ1]|uniref:Glycosyltransferase family 4 protein n=1 Tax=Leptolyngbya boryana CZ1 TaxID=3060204 RepID=A0AA96WYF0_LEPBY|nr:glycosyltransferase family 4 protein [Leptolyngbya boryana]WNZ47631.1 glycosyltransferase family 4 protein [Leptolyngbya boryana CZ1]
MKILQIHNRYKIPGGEDTVVRCEYELLKQYQHDVRRLEVDNDDIQTVFDKINIAIGTIYSRSGARKVTEAVQAFQPDVVHVYNFFPKISPAVYYACKRLGVPVVQSLQNYRLFCASPYFYRDGKVCEDCVGQAFPISGIVHGCYQGSRIGTAAIATMQYTHRLLNTWNEGIDQYIALTDFARDKYVEAGLPASKMIVKPNFLPIDPGQGNVRENYILFAGRLSPEKGIEVVIEAWKTLADEIPLKIVGQGALEAQVMKACQHPNIEWLGHQSHTEVLSLMKKAQALLFPSLWYECLPMVIVEAYAVGLPVIASNLGSQSTLIKHRQTGLHFEAGNTRSLVEQVRWFLTHPEAASQMRQGARHEYETRYTAEENYKMLIDIYQAVCPLVNHSLPV